MDAVANELFVLTDRSGVSVVQLLLPDQLDGKLFDRLNETLLPLIDRSPKWVIDCARVSYMGSAMLGLMVNLRQRVRTAKGSLVISGLSPRLAEVFRATSLERLFVFTKTLDEALARSI